MDDTRSQAELLKENETLNNMVDRLTTELFDLQHQYRQEVELRKLYEERAAGYQTRPHE